MFAVNLQVELFSVTVANAKERLKSLHTLYDTYFNHMLAKFKPNQMLLNVQNYDVLKPFLTKL